MKLSFVLTLTVFVLGATASKQTSATASNGGLARISAYNGTWTLRIVHYHMKQSKARTQTAVVRNECTQSTDFYMCHQFLDGKSAALVVYTYDRKNDLYHTHAITSGADPAPGGVLRIAGSIWTYPWQAKDKTGKISYMRIVNTFHDADTIDYREELSPDNVHWTQTASGVERRVQARG